MVVRDYLVKNFKLEDLRIKTMAVAKSADAGNNGEVEILVYPPGTEPPENQRP